MNYIEKFYEDHPLKKLKINGKEWEYIACGKGSRTFLIFPGGGETAQLNFQFIKALENRYRLIVPTVCDCDSIEEFDFTINKILSKEKAGKLIVYGLSLGGLLAQCFLRRNKDKVEKVIISHACTPKSKLLYKRVIRPLKALNVVLPLLPNRLITTFTRNFAGRIQGGSKQIGKQFLSLLTEEERQLNDAFRKEFYEKYLNKRLLKTWINLQLDFYRNERFSADDLKNWPGQILILRTDNDPLMQDEGDFKIIYPKAKVYTFKGTGHLTFRYQFHKMLKAIKEFLQS